jgi:hypothetical protein
LGVIPEVNQFLFVVSRFNLQVVDLLDHIFLILVHQLCVFLLNLVGHLLTVKKGLGEFITLGSQLSAFESQLFNLTVELTALISELFAFISELINFFPRLLQIYFKSFHLFTFLG